MLNPTKRTDKPPTSTRCDWTGSFAPQQTATDRDLESRTEQEQTGAVQRAAEKKEETSTLYSIAVHARTRGREKGGQTLRERETTHTTVDPRQLLQPNGNGGAAPRFGRTGKLNRCGG
ncbi:hypothetical protein CRG98_024046 [Punica granatum]|uniref:Uncharacterized protein n=1 Tax=Punica granatum TaxID=22663 RepID=A0A2I0JIW3_PUNGR|nr:hypothetical protein CRG98_024046 [Punica granatum]